MEEIRVRWWQKMKSQERKGNRGPAPNRNLSRRHSLKRILATIRGLYNPARLCELPGNRRLVSFGVDGEFR